MYEYEDNGFNSYEVGESSENQHDGYKMMDEMDESYEPMDGSEGMPPVGGEEPPVEEGGEFGEMDEDAPLSPEEEQMLEEEATMQAETPPEGMPPEGEAPPPHPEGYVNDFIAPLFDGAPEGENGEPAWGLDFNVDDPANSSWTLPIPPDAVDMEGNSFTVDANFLNDIGSNTSADVPEATDNGDGTFTINSWPINEMVDNGDGTVTMQVDIGMPPPEGDMPPPEGDVAINPLTGEPMEGEGVAAEPEMGLTGKEAVNPLTGEPMEGEMPPPEGDVAINPLTGEPMEGEMPPPEGDVPPPHPDGYVNEFIAPLFDGTNGTLEYSEDGPSSWTVPCPPDAVDMEHNCFTVGSDLVGEWEGGIPPEAHPSEDGNGYVINSWPISDMVDNGDGTVTLTVDIGNPPPEGEMPPPPPPEGWEGTPV